jgi:hypothetical protein
MTKWQRLRLRTTSIITLDSLVLSRLADTQIEARNAQASDDSSCRRQIQNDETDGMATFVRAGDLDQYFPCRSTRFLNDCD